MWLSLNTFKRNKDTLMHFNSLFSFLLDIPPLSQEPCFIIIMNIYKPPQNLQSIFIYIIFLNITICV